MVRCLHFEFPVHPIGPVTSSSGNIDGIWSFVTRNASDIKLTHDVHHPVTADIPRILTSAYGACTTKFAVTYVHGGELNGADVHDVSCQALRHVVMPLPQPQNGTPLKWLFRKLLH